MKDRVPANPGRVLITPETGAAAFYATMTRADNPTQEGDPLNKNTLLKDETAAKFGFGDTAVPDDVFSKIKELFESYKEYALGKSCNAVGQNGGISYANLVNGKEISGKFGTTGETGSKETLSITYDFSALPDNVRLCRIDGFTFTNASAAGISTSKFNISAIININGTNVDFGFAGFENVSLGSKPDYYLSSDKASFNISAIYGRPLTKDDQLKLLITFENVSTSSGRYYYYDFADASADFRCLEA